MLAGELPLQAANTPSMLMKHISERPRPLGEVRPDLPANLVYAIERAMAKGRDDRWPDAGAFRDALAEHGVVAAGRSARPGQARRAASIRDRLPAADRRSSRGPRIPAFRRCLQGWMLDPNTREYGREALREWKEETRRWRERYGRQAMPIGRLGASARNGSSGARSARGCSARRLRRIGFGACSGRSSAESG